ncbi:MAG: NAD(P)-binding domain-containing protein [Rhizomicrobium sp.]
MADMLGFTTLGELGEAVARRLLTQSTRLAVFDADDGALSRLARLGARVLESPRQVADCAEFVFGAPTGEQAAPLARSVAQGQAARIFVNISTIGPPAIRVLEEVLGSTGIRLVDAPLSGTPKEADRGTLRLVLSGAAADLDRVEKIAAAFASRISKMGERPGQAQICALIGDALGLTALAASCEAVAVGTAAGIASGVLVDVIDAGTGRNSATADLLPHDVLTRTFGSGESLGDALGKLDLYLDEAAGVRIPAGVVAETRALAAKAADQIGPAQDVTAIVRYFEAFVGAKVAG